MSLVVMIVGKLSGLFQTGMVAAPLMESTAFMLLNQVIYSVLKSFEIDFCMTGGMDILDLRTGHVVRTLIPKIAEGIFDVIAMFTKTNEYVLYYHSGRKTIRSCQIS